MEKHKLDIAETVYRSYGIIGGQSGNEIGFSPGTSEVGRN
jgi:hypothetical protein